MVGLTLCAQHIDLRYRAGLAGGANQVQHVFIVSHDLLRNPDLCAQCGNLQRFNDDVAADAQRGSLELRRFVLRGGGGLIDAAKLVR